MRSLLCFFMFLSLILVVACTTTELPEHKATPTAAQFPDTPELPGLSIQAESDVITVGEDTANLLWKNDSEYTVVFGEGFMLYKKHEDIWTQLERIKDEPIPDIGYDILPGTQRWHTYQFTLRFGQLDAGDYKIYENVYVPMLEENYSVYYDFTIS